MNVKELIEVLNKLPPEMGVSVTSNQEYFSDAEYIYKYKPKMGSPEIIIADTSLDNDAWCFHGMCSSIDLIHEDN